MIKVYNFENCELLPKAYGGNACQKECIEFMGVPYMLKYPGKMRGLGFKNTELSYSNGSVCEYLGSHIYKILGMESHETILGYRGGKLCVACKDFLDIGSSLYEFSKIKRTGYREFEDSDGNPTNGTGTDLEETLEVIRSSSMLSKIPDVKKIFWKMFITDAFIGNPDRNNDNWGIIYNRFTGLRMAPVYDCGSCLNNKWDENKMLRYMNDEKLFLTEAYRGKTCIYTLGGKKINPYHIIMGGNYDECNRALLEIFDEINLKSIFGLFVELRKAGVLSSIQEDFYRKMLTVRYNEVLKPVYEKLR